MKLVTLALAVMALAVPAGLLFTTSHDSLLVDRGGVSTAQVVQPVSSTARDYAAR